MRILIIAFCALQLLACQNSSEKIVSEVVDKKVSTDNTLLEMLHDFESDIISPNISLSGVDAYLVKGDSTALNVKYRSKDNSYTSFALKPNKPFDWSEYDDFNIAFDISNAGEHSVQVFLDISDASGATYTRSVSIPTGAEKTYYAKLAGHDLATPKGRDDVELNFKSGLRNNPPTWASDDIQFISYKKKI